MFPSHDRKFPHTLTLDGKRISWEQDEKILPTIHGTEAMSEFDDANSSLTHPHPSSSVHETGSTDYSEDMACGPVLSLEAPAELEAASVNRLSSDFIMPIESVVSVWGSHAHCWLVADLSLTGRLQSRARLAPVPEETITTKTARLPLWQKMENKVAISRVKKAKERLQYRKMKGSSEEVDGEEVRGEGFVDQEIWKLREELGAYATTYGVYDSHPPHPNHHQTWFSKNLRCTVCTENCGICGVACCKWSQAKTTEREAYLASEEMVTATRTIQRIEVYLHTGFDLPSFLRCTECRILVCPSCCGLCPVVMCQDLRCNKCTEDPWRRCEYHDETDE